MLSFSFFARYLHFHRFLGFMNHFSRFLRALSPMCAVFVVGATALASGHSAMAKTLSFGSTPSSHARISYQSRDAFVNVGVTPTPSSTSANLANVGGFSTLLGPTAPSSRGWRLAATGVVQLSFSATSYTVSENAGVVSNLVRVDRSGDTTLSTTVQYATANGTATQPGDYITTSGTLTFGPNEVSKFIPIQIVNDNVSELSETFTINLSVPNSGNGTTTTISTGTANININDDDSAIQFTQTLFSVTEGTGSAQLTLTRTGDSSSATSVNYAFTDGTAIAGQDYTGQNGTINFAANQTSRTIFVPITNDTLDEGDETFTVTLSVPAGNGNTTLGPNTTATVTIVDNDDTLVGIASDNYTVNENGGTATITVTRSGDKSRAITVDYTTSNGTATQPNDYTFTSGTLTFNANQTTQTIQVPIIDDTIAENTENFRVRIFNPAFVTPPTDNIFITLSPNATTTVTILDDDPSVNFDATTYSVNEDVGTVTIGVTRKGNTGAVATVDYATANGIAIAGQDYTATSGTLTFGIGETTKAIQVPIINDPSDEDDETFTVTLSNPSATTSLGVQFKTTVTITDDDGVPTITIADVSQAEGDSGQTFLKFTVTLSAPSGRTITLDYATSDGSATDGLTVNGNTSTTEDKDYDSTSGTLTLTPDPLTGITKDLGDGANKRIIQVPISGDTKYENDEAFIMTISNATNSTISIRKAVGTILNDDPVPASTFNFSPVQPSFAENIGNGTLTITRTGDTTTAASVTLTTANGTAISGADYTAVSTVLSFGVGVTSKTVSVAIFNDSVNEADETFSAILSNPQGYASLGANATATVTIVNDDADPTLTIGTASVREGDSGTVNLVFPVTIDADSEQTLTVQYATADGNSATASQNATIADNDYVATSGTLTFAPGDRSQNITVAVNGDLNIESDETLRLLLTNPQHLMLGSTSTTGTILNDDTPPTFSNVAFVSTNVSVNEGVGSATITLKRTTGTDRVATIDYVTSNGTATAGADYTAKSGTVTFPVNQTMATITVPIIDDTLQEPGAAETFKVILSNPGGNSQPPAQTTATVSITDNDGTPTLSVANTNVLEGDSGRSSLVFTVSLFPQSKNTVKVQIATTGGTASNSGSGQDYRSKTAVLTFAPGQGTQTFAVDVAGDTIVEEDETVTVLLSNPQGAPLATNGKTAIGTILNDDEPGGGGTIYLLSPSYTVNENAGTAAITLGRTGKIDLINEQSATVRFVTGTGSATPGQDYRAVNTVVTFPAGETTASVNIPILDDTVFEGDENVSLSINTPSNNAILGSQTTATLTITDNDPMSSIPRADSLTPSSPVGSPFTVKATYSSDLGVNDLSPVLIQIGGNAAGNGFRALYDPKTNYLAISPGTGQKVRPGAHVVLTNQFGSLDASKTTILRSGNTLTVTWTISLTSTVALPIYTGATGSSGQSVFVRRGTWRPAAAASAKGS
ncbi:hypothetical protein IAD21_05940 [Abditibacteriota bacterium]|nr:hypothetical protein IAD21_05940 [Abditibacteriota bacterium]